MSQNWDIFLKEANESIRAYYSPIVADFLVADNIDQKKFLANRSILDNSGREIHKLSAQITGDTDLGDFGTKSIDAIAWVSKQPLGYEYWFMAAYPDVVLWVTDAFEHGDHALLSKIFGDNVPEDMLGENKKINHKYLRMMIDFFKKSGTALECALDDTADSLGEFPMFFVVGDNDTVVRVDSIGGKAFATAVSAGLPFPLDKVVRDGSKIPSSDPRVRAANEPDARP